MLFKKKLHLIGAAVLLAAAAGCATPVRATMPTPTAEAAAVFAVADAKTVTPESCVTAIRLARETFTGTVTILDGYQRVIQAIPGALESAMYGRASGIEELTRVLEDVNDDMVAVNAAMDPEAFNSAADDCEAGR